MGTFVDIPPSVKTKTTTTSKKSTTAVNTNAAKIAKRIYDSKGVTDDEAAAVEAVESIRNKSEFDAVQQELIKLTGGRQLGQYVTSFISNRSQLQRIQNKIVSIGVPQTSMTWKILDKKINPTVDTTTTAEKEASWLTTGNLVFYGILTIAAAGILKKSGLLKKISSVFSKNGTSVPKALGTAADNPEFLKYINDVPFFAKRLRTDKGAKKFVAHLYRYNYVTKEEANALFNAFKSPAYIAQFQKEIRNIALIAFKNGKMRYKNAYDILVPANAPADLKQQWEAYLTKVGERIKLPITTSAEKAAAATKAAKATSKTVSSIPRFSKRFTNITSAQFNTLTDAQKRALANNPTATYDQIRQFYQR